MVTRRSDFRIPEQEEFLWLPEMATADPRDRSDLPSHAKKIEWVAPEELDAAVHFILKAAYGAPRQEVLREVGRLLGFARTTAQISKQIEKRVDAMIDRGEIRAASDQLHVNSYG